MVAVLAVADEVSDGLYANVRTARGTELILACGDLPFEYLAYLMDALEAPLVFVPGNHDPDVRDYRISRSGLSLRAGLPEDAPWPPGAINADGRVVDVSGLRIAGLGGCSRYSAGPNQYGQRRQAARARALARRAWWRRAGDGRAVDVLLAHAPPRGVGDGPDAPHRGFDCLAPLVRRIRTPLLLHGHVHPYGVDTPDLHVGSTVVRNVVGHHLFDVPAGDVSAAR